MHSSVQAEGGRPMLSQQRYKRRESRGRRVVTSSRDLLQGDGVTSPVVRQIGIGRRVLLLHVDSLDEAKLNRAQFHYAMLAACAIRCSRCHVYQRRTNGAVWERERACLFERKNVPVCVRERAQPSLPSFLFLLARSSLQQLTARVDDVIIHRERRSQAGRPYPL